MRLALVLFVASVLHGESPQGLIYVQVGALGCAAVMRDVDRIQTYCYAPGNVLDHNTIDTVYTRLVVPYQWCADPPPTDPACTYASITWKFTLIPAGTTATSISGKTSIFGRIFSKLTKPRALSAPAAGGMIGYEYSVNGDSAVSGTLTGIYVPPPVAGIPCPDAGQPGVSPNCTMVGTLTGNGCSAFGAPWTPVALASVPPESYATIQQMIADKVTYQMSKQAGCILPTALLVGIR